MAEKYHDDVLKELDVVHVRTGNAINAVHELIRNGAKYKDSDKATLVTSIKSSCSAADCPSLADYEGNAS